MCKKLIVLMCLLWLGGCATMRQVPIRISEEEIENAKALKVVARNCLSITAFQVGMLEGGLGEDINKLPASAITAIEEMKQLSALDPNSLTDEQLGLSLGLRLRILCTVVKEALAIYAPEVLLFLL